MYFAVKYFACFRKEFQRYPQTLQKMNSRPNDKHEVNSYL